MATKYVRKTGSDSNGGTSTSDAWLTIGKALTTMSSGDTCYVGAGTYREVVTVTISPVAETKLIGDIDGSHTGDSGPVIWTSYLTNDKTAASASPTCNLNGKDFLTFRNLWFISGLNAGCIDATTTTSTNIVVQDCVIHPSGTVGINMTTVFGTPLHWLIDRCAMGGGFGSAGPVAVVQVTAPTGSGSDYDLDVVIQNCLVMDGQLVVATTGTSAQHPGGVIIRNCSLFGHIAEINFNSSRLSTSIVCKAVNNFVWSSTGMVSLTASAITEDYNVFCCPVPTSGTFNSGGHSITDNSYAPMVHDGYVDIARLRSRPVGEPLQGSPLLGFGDDGNAPSVDMLGRPRPAGGQSALKAAGCLERGNTWAKEVSTVRTGSAAISITGPGYQDFPIPVDAVLTTVSVYARYDATYAGSTKPQLQVLYGGECGVSDATASFGDANSDADPGSGAWGKLVLPFTPTSKGIVTMRILSSDTNGGGKAFADDFAVI